MDNIKTIQEICNYFQDARCIGCPFSNGLCMFATVPDVWNKDKIDKICKNWENECVTLGKMLNFLCPGINSLKKNICPDILEPKFVKEYNCPREITSRQQCDECWDRFLGQRIHKDMIKEFLDK